MAAVLGIGDGILNTQISALLALLFKHDTVNNVTRPLLMLLLFLFTETYMKGNNTVLLTYGNRKEPLRS